MNRTKSFQPKDYFKLGLRLMNRTKSFQPNPDWEGF